MIFPKSKKSLNLSGGAGFTLLEIIISISIFSVLTFAATSLLISIIQNPKLQLAQMDNIDQARFVSSRFANEIRAAAYGSYPLIEAGDSEIIFYSPIGASAGNINRIRYYISDNTLYKGIIAPAGGIYNPEAEVITSVLTGISNEGAPLFYYYDGDYDGIASVDALSQPVNITEVRFVKINLIVQYQTTTQDVGTFSLSAGGAIRILKNNLSN